MATVTLGNVKFNWKGPYNNSTAYVVDDVVSSGGSSYVCILASTGNAVSNGTYWQQMSAAGTDGTDLTSTLTTQGDILYRDGSGLQRLAAGTANQVLQTGGAGANPSWGTVSSDFVKITSGSISSGVSSYNIDGHFSSTYKTYELIFDDVYVSSTGIDLYMRIIEGGSVISGANYAYAYRYQGVNSSGQNNVGDTGGWTSTSAGVTNNLSSHINQSAMLHFRIYDPLATDKYKTITHHNFANYNNNDGVLSQIGGFQYRSLNALSGLQIFCSSGTIQAGNWSLYGIKP